MSYLVVVDSFVKYLWKYQLDILKKELFIKVNEEEKKVKIYGVGGWKLENVIDFIEKIEERCSRIVISCGGNNLERRPLDRVKADIMKLYNNIGW